MAETEEMENRSEMTHLPGDGDHWQISLGIFAEVQAVRIERSGKRMSSEVAVCRQYQIIQGSRGNSKLKNCSLVVRMQE